MIQIHGVKQTKPTCGAEIQSKINASQSNTPHKDCFNRKALRSALRLHNNPQEMGRHPLAYLNVVKIRCGAGFETDPIQRGNALRETLYLAIEALKPNDGPVNLLERAWFPYSIITRQYLEKKSVTLLAQQMCIGRSIYFKEQNRALDLLASVLQRAEQSCAEASNAGNSPPPFLAPPHPVHSLVGREALLNRLKQRLFAEQPTAINGIPGVGKTALTTELAHDPEVLTSFNDGILWAALGRHPDVLTLLSAWGTALSIPPNEISSLDTVEERARRIHDAIGLRRMLLVIDDAWQVETAAAFKVGGPNCAHLLTTRSPEVAHAFAGDGAILVSELSEDDSVTLLGQMAPQAIDEEPEKVRSLAHAVGGLPLALTLMGWHLRKETRAGQPRRLHRSLEQLRHTQARLLITQPQTLLERRPDVPAETPHSLQTIIKISDETLEPIAQQALRALSALRPKPNTFPKAAILAIIDASDAILDTLVEHGLLEINSAGRYTLHQTIADYAGLELAKDPVAQRSAYERMVEFFVQYAEAHVRDFPALEAESHNIMAALDVAFKEGMPAALVRGTNAISWFLVDTRSRALIETYHTRAERTARELGDPRLLAPMLHNLAYEKHRQGKYEHAKALLYEEMALVQDKDPGATSEIFKILGAVAVACGDYPQAKEHYQRGLALAQEIGWPNGALLGNLGTVCWTLGQTQEGASYMEKALAEHRKNGNRNSESLCLTNLSDVYQETGQIEKALDCSQQALHISREVGNRKHENRALSNLGSISLEMGKVQQALGYLQQTLLAFRVAGDRRHECIALGNIGECYLLDGQPERAREYYQQALDIACETGDRAQAGEWTGGLGRAYRDLEQMERAREYTEQALSIAREVGDRRNESAHLCTLGKLYPLGQIQATTDDPSAITHYQQALEIARAINNPLIEGECLSLLGKAYRDLGQNETAAEYLRQTLAALEDITSPRAAKIREEIALWEVECLTIKTQVHKTSNLAAS